MKGLRQGDPLSPMLFILAMEPLQRLLEMATQREILTPPTTKVARIRVSFYADDAAVFVNPIREEVKAIRDILQCFGEVSGLKVNISKCTAYPIRCDGINLDEVLEAFGGTTANLPCKYLGLPLSIRKLRRVEIQPLLDKSSARLKPWKGKLITRPGRLILVNSVITAMATYFLTIFTANVWAEKRLNKIRRNFQWNADEEGNGGKCLVNWKAICAPKHYGGLDIKDIGSFGRSLRLRWLWYEWQVEDKPWKGTAVPCDTIDRQLFAACTTITIGDGSIARFWNEKWLMGQAPKDIAPKMFCLARRKNLTVKDALTEGRWMKGLQRIESPEDIDQFINLWELIQNIQLTAEHDCIKWNLTGDGFYSAKSAYHFQFLTRIPQPRLENVWRAKAEPKVKFYNWLLLQNRNWTSDRLQHRDWPHSDKCVPDHRDGCTHHPHVPFRKRGLAFLC